MKTAQCEMKCADNFAQNCKKNVQLDFVFINADASSVQLNARPEDP